MKSQIRYIEFYDCLEQSLHNEGDQAIVRHAGQMWVDGLNMSFESYLDSQLQKLKRIFSQYFLVVASALGLKLKDLYKIFTIITM